MSNPLCTELVRALNVLAKTTFSQHMFILYEGRLERNQMGASSRVAEKALGISFSDGA